MVFTTQRSFRRALVIACSAYLVNATVATWVAISSDISGRPFGLVTGLPVAWDFAFGLGSGLSAPLSMLIALALLTVSVAGGGGRRSLAWIGFLGWCFLVGMLVEPVLGEAIRGEREPLVVGIIAANLLLPIAILGLARGAAGQSKRDPDREPSMEHLNG